MNLVPINKKHFRLMKVFVLKVLKEHAVPSLYPVCSGCIIPGCVNKHRNTSNMYSIPVWRKCTLWLEYLPHLKHYNHFKLLTYRVCEEHFEEVSESNMFNLVLSRNLPSKYVYTFNP